MSDEKLDLEKIPASPPDLIKESAGLRPHYPNAYGYDYGYASDNQKIHLRELWHTVKKRKWLIISLASIITTLVAIEVYRTKNTYQASVLIEIGKDTSTLGRPGSIFGDDYDPFYMVNIKTKMLMVKSHSLLENVVLTKKLDQNAVFLASPGKKTVWEALRTMGAKVGIKEQSQGEAANPAVITASTPEDESLRTKEEKEKIERCIRMLEAGLTVEPVKETRALRISYIHTDPKLAADLANAVAQDFLDQNFENKTAKFTSAASWLKDSTNKLKAQVQQSEEALAKYTREHGIFATDKEGTLTSSKLQNLHDQVLRASTDRMLKHSLHEEVKEGRVERLPEAYGDLLFKSSPKVVDLQKQLSDLETEAAELQVKLGPENPRLVTVREKITAIKSQIEDSTKSLEERLKTEYERAVRDEAMLRSALAQAKSEAIQQNQDAIQYNILKQDVETNKALYQDFLQKTNQADAQRAEQQNNLRVIEPARVPNFPVGPRRMFAIFLGLLLSTAAGIGLAFFLDYLDNTIKTVEDVGRYAQLPALSVIPAVSGGPSRRLSVRSKRFLSNGGSNTATQLATLDNRSSVAEAYRVLRTSVLLSAAGHAPKSILITSGQAGEGKTTTVVNTAISLSQMGASVLIVDCDLRRPTAHKILEADHHQGLSTYLSNDTTTIDDVIQKLPIANLSLLPCGPIPPNPAELIISDRMKDLLRELSERYDHILVDSPPLISVTDPVILSTMVDGVILVVHGGKSTREIVRRARQELSNVGAKIFGVVLNNVDLRREGYDYYYYSRYYSGYARDGAGASPQ